MYNNCDAQNQDNTQLHLQPAIIITVSESTCAQLTGY